MTRTGVAAWPEHLAQLYRARGYWRDRTLGSLPRQWAHSHGDRPALLDGDVTLTYRQLADRVDVLAAHLISLGLRGGDNILVQLPNRHELVLLVLACARIGVAPVLMLPAHREHEMVAIGRHTEAAAIVTADSVRGFDHRALAHRVAREVPSIGPVIVVGGDDRRSDMSTVDFAALLTGECDESDHARLAAATPDPGEVALFLLSGGTTGVPKVISRTHNDYEYNSRRSAEVCGFGPDTVYLVVLPAAHNFTLGSPGILGTLMAGGRVVLLPSPSVVPAFEAIAEHGVTHTAAVPAVVRRWAEAVDELSPRLESLRVLQVGGSLFAPELARRAREALGCRVQQVFGMAEGLLNYTRLDEDDDLAARTQGRPISPDDEIRVVDTDGAEVPPGQEGELLTRGPYTPRGYFAAPEHNERSFAPGGWYRTGDLVRLDPSGNLVVVGRAKDVINRGGEKIAAAELEQLIATLPTVAEVAAIPFPDPELGERICVYVLPRPGHWPALSDIEELFAERGVADYKVPERLRVVDVLPYTEVGKVDKKALCAREAATATEVRPAG